MTGTSSEAVPPLPVVSEKYNNADLFIWALDLVGGRSDYVDLEDVYLKCFELAPKRFGWRTRPDLPAIDKLGYSRRDALKRQNRLGVRMIDALEVDVTEGRSVPSYRWRLTEAGANWCDAYKDQLAALYGGGTEVPPSTRQTQSRLVKMIRSSDLYLDWDAGDHDYPPRVAVADVLECSPASESKLFNERLEKVNAAARFVGDQSVSDFVKWLRASLEGEMEA